MKFQVLSTAALAALILASCGGGAEPETTTSTTPEASPAAPVTYGISAENSKLMWTGTMLGVKSHNGLVSVSEGVFTLEGEQLKGGKIAVDLKGITPVDTNYAPDGSEQGTRSMLIGHLQSPDFFAVDSFPNATFVVTSVEGNTATGDLTVRGRTHSEQLTDITVKADENKATVTGTLVFDRQKYGVAWASPMKDVVLSDDIELQVEVTGMAR